MSKKQSHGRVMLDTSLTNNAQRCLLMFTAFLLSNKLLCTSQMLYCDESKKYCPGDLVTATCSIQNEVLLWIIETHSSPYELKVFEIDFSDRNMVGDKETDGAFSANLSKHYPCPDNISESILTFKYTQDNISLGCINLKNLSLSQTCLIGNQKDTLMSVQNVMATAERVCQDIIISWNDSEISSAHIDHYCIELERNACIFESQAKSFNLSKLEYGISYNVSISACSCVQCGPKTTYYFDSSDLLTEAVLREHLVVDSIIDYYVENAGIDQYKTTVFWNRPHESCALLYTVSRIEMENHSQETFNTTVTYLTSLLDSRITYKFRVAAINGEVAGSNSSELCIYIDVPKRVLNISGNITIDSESDEYFLVVAWVPPVNGTCTRPQVTSYNISSNGEVWSESKSNTYFRLPTTIREGVSSVIPVYVSAINTVGEGPTSSFLLHLPSKALSCTLSGVHFTLLLFLAMLSLLGI